MVTRAFLFGFLLLGQVDLANADAPPITQVTSNIYRGRRPDEATIAALAKMNVKTILNLENDETVVAAETAVAEQYGIQVISTPMSGFWRPKDAQVSLSLQVLANATDASPVFVHCQHGEDRTGLIVGLYRVQLQNWRPADAYEEMIKSGFHSMLVFLKEYFEDKTGFDD